MAHRILPMSAKVRLSESISARTMYLTAKVPKPGSPTTPSSERIRTDQIRGRAGSAEYTGEVFYRKNLDCRVFGVNGKNFIKTMLNLGKTHDHLTVVNDQFGSPTYTYDLARLLVDMVLTDKYGIYHATNEGICNWYEFACEIFRKAGINMDVAPVPASEYPTKAKRPENSRMSKEKLTENGFQRLPSWQDALERYLPQIQ